MSNFYLGLLVQFTFTFPFFSRTPTSSFPSPTSHDPSKSKAERLKSDRQLRTLFEISSPFIPKQCEPPQLISNPSVLSTVNDILFLPNTLPVIFFNAFNKSSFFPLNDR